MTSSAGESEILTNAEIEARKRRERILQLKRKAEKKTENPVEVEEPKKERLEEPPPAEKDESDGDDDDDDDDDEESICDRTNEDKTESEELDLSKLVSRKVDWDLKRGIEKNLAILQDRTNEVIAEIVQESMGSDEEEED